VQAGNAGRRAAGLSCRRSTGRHQHNFYPNRPPRSKPRARRNRSAFGAMPATSCIRAGCVAGGVHALRHPARVSVQHSSVNAEQENAAKVRPLLPNGGCLVSAAGAGRL